MCKKAVILCIVLTDDERNDEEVETSNAKVQDGKILYKWKVIYMEDNDDTESQQEKNEKGYTLPEYVFTVECDGVESEESGKLDVMGWIKTQFKDKKTGKPLANRKYNIYLFDGTIINGTTDNEGYIDLKDLKFGKYIICL